MRKANRHWTPVPFNTAAPERVDQPPNDALRHAKAIESGDPALRFASSRRGLLVARDGTALRRRITINSHATKDEENLK
jgi:hypothetical protein